MYKYMFIASTVFIAFAIFALYFQFKFHKTCKSKNDKMNLIIKTNLEKLKGSLQEYKCLTCVDTGSIERIDRLINLIKKEK